MTSNTYWDWFIDRVFLIVPAQTIVGEFLGTFLSSRREWRRRASRSTRCRRSSRRRSAAATSAMEAMERIAGGRFLWARASTIRRRRRSIRWRSIRIGSTAARSLTSSSRRSSRRPAIGRSPSARSTPRSSPARRRRTWSRARSCSPGPPVRWTCATSASGGPGRRAPVARPEGPRSSIEGREGHPVVHVAYEDAEAYASWAGLALPPRPSGSSPRAAGSRARRYVWGDDPEQDGGRLANYWHGDFPVAGEPATARRRRSAPSRRTASGSSTWPATSGSGRPTGTSDRHPQDEDKPCCVPRNPRGGDVEGSYDPAQPQFPIPRKVIKGGSFLCADSYCMRYRPAARRPQMIDTGTSHIGFRCAWRPTAAGRAGGRVRSLPRPVGGIRSSGIENRGVVTLAVIIVICVVLFLLAIALPLWSRRPQRGGGAEPWAPGLARGERRRASSAGSSRSRSVPRARRATRAAAPDVDSGSASAPDSVRVADATL